MVLERLTPVTKSTLENFQKCWLIREQYPIICRSMFIPLLAGNGGKGALNIFLSIFKYICCFNCDYLFQLIGTALQDNFVREYKKSWLHDTPIKFYVKKKEKSCNLKKWSSKCDGKIWQFFMCFKKAHFASFSSVLKIFYGLWVHSVDTWSNLHTLAFQTHQLSSLYDS